MKGIVKMFINQLDILFTREDSALDLVVSNLIRGSPMNIKRALCINVLDSWCIKPDEESTLCKISILYHLAND